MERLTIFDSTLRDGAQGQGISFSVGDKLHILELLDELGIPYVEAGNPFSNPKDREFFREAAGLSLKQTRLTAFGSTRRPGSTAEKDPGLAALLEAGTEAVSIFGKASAFHVEQVLRTSREENLEMIGDSIRFLASRGREVIFDAEHFFDGWKQDAEYAEAVIRTAETAGAQWIVLCDTNGGALPEEVFHIVSEIKGKTSARLGIHCHNDIGCAVANSLLAVQAGAVQVQGTLLGFGERCGNANLAALMPTLQLKLGYDCIPAERMAELTQYARALGEIANVVPDAGMPYVGSSAFSHKGGMHIDGVMKIPASFEHIDPASVGNQRNVLMSEVAGRAAVSRMMGGEIAKDSDMAAKIVALVKEREFLGYQYEYAAASLQLMALRQQENFRPFFKVLYSRTIGEQTVEDQRTNGSSAIVKIQVGDTCEIGGGEGEGPVHALDRALRKAVGKFYPSLERTRLTDYKVRVIEPKDATAAKVRVLVETTDGREVWSTVGVSRDIINASLQACVDAIEYKLWLDSREGKF